MGHCFRHRARNALDGGDLFSGGFADHDGAGARGFPVEVHHAGTAHGVSAAEFGSGQIKFVADRPEQRHLRAYVELV